MTADLESCIREFGLDEHRGYLLDVARPSIAILTTQDPVPPGCSKFGGSPDLPAGFEWPHHALGPYRFIGQINLSDIPSGPHGLPDRGLLSFFYAHDEHGESFWGDPDYVRAYRFPDAGALGTVEPPAAVRLGSTAVLAFQLGADVPPWPWDDVPLAVWPIDASLHEAYDEFRSRLHPTRRYLLGYPYNTTLAYDPTPGPEWRSLLTLSSDDALEWYWHDGDWLVTFIEAHRLRAGDFSQINADAG
ncbi:MAG TPA: YwqG family protein [Longimicrobium sp.]|nr:YwqG family protein [Longimicrobium sp.]